MCHNNQHQDNDCGFKKGLVVGGLIGGALVALASTRRAQEMRERLVNYSEDLYRELQESAEDWAAQTKEKYLEMVDKVTEEFVKSKKLALHLKKQLSDKLEEKWDDFQADQLYRQVKVKFEELAEKTRMNYDKLVETVVQEYMASEDRGEAGIVLANKLKRALKQSERYQKLKQAYEDSVAEKSQSEQENIV